MGDEPLKTKRKAKTEDGPDKKMKLDPSITTFEVQPEVENFQREALWRSLQDYKRRATQSQEQLEKLKKTSQYHDDHLRIVDLWWDQLVDEVRSLLPPKDVDASPAMNGVSERHFLDTVPEFTAHITSKRQGIINMVVNSVKSLQSSKHEPSDISEFEIQNRELMARVKLLEMDAKKLQIEKDEREPKIAELQDRLASSQRKVDRQKSITLARIEQQARRAPGASSPMNPVKPEEDAASAKSPKDTTNGQSMVQDQASLNIAIEKHMKELAELQTQLATTREQNATLSRRLDSLDDLDIQEADSYKTLKKANEHLRGQNEFFENRHKSLSKELSDFKSERSAYRTSVEEEFASQMADLTGQLNRAEQDLARVRSARDELHSSLQVRKGQDDIRSASAREISELADTQATRISALEAEIARLKEEYPANDISQAEDASHTTDQLQTRVQQLQRENQSLKNELPTMEQAFNQAHEQNMRKIMELATAEERISRLQGEKSKADQKYFAAMKAKDQLSLELKTAKTAIGKSTDAIARLTETEETIKEKVNNLEKQIALLEESSDLYKTDLSKATATADELRLLKESNDKKLAEAINRADGKDREVADITNAKRLAEQDLEQTKTLYDALKSAQPDTKLSLESEQVQVYKGIAMCSVCSVRWKNTAITSCGHVFCKECIDKRIETRQRRCPNCNKGFGSGDVLSVHL